ncbi:hypothetical protein OFQ66_09545 [Brachyspira hyodysenteriae]|nr:hypothetical protein [Brachyspira hyodysenteriae]
MENNISNEEQIRNKFERIFQYENNKNAFLDYFYGISNSCPTLRNYYGYEAEDIFKFYFDEKTSEKDKKALSKYAETVIKDIYKNQNVHIILRLCTGEDLEKALIESYNNTYERTIYDKKYSKATLANNEASKYIQIQINNFGRFSELEAYVSKDFNKYLEKVKNDNKALLNKEPHLLLTILVYLINRDDDKSLIKQLLNYIDSLKINDEETISLLFSIVDKDEEVYKRLMNILNKDNNMIYFLVNIYKDMTRTIKLYKRLFKGYSEDKGYYYYTQKLIPEYLELCNFPKECILLNIIVNNNTLFISYLTVEAKKLYDEDKETFYRLYEIIEKSKLENLYLDYAMLSSIMLASGDNKYNIDTNSIVETLKTMCVELLKIMQPIKTFDEITSKALNM